MYVNRLFLQILFLSEQGDVDERDPRIREEDEMAEVEYDGPLDSELENNCE